MREPVSDGELEALVQTLAAYRVDYLLIGGQAARLHGVQHPSYDIDLVPRRSTENLQLLCDALNLLHPRWLLNEGPGGIVEARIDGRWLEPRHFPPTGPAVGLVTRLGVIDVVAEAAAVGGHDAWARRARVGRVGAATVRIGSLEDLIASKEAAGRPKDYATLPALRELLALQRRDDRSKVRDPADGPADE